MNETPTPETDAEVYDPKGCDRVQTVLADFARTLETRLRQAEKELGMLKHANKDLVEYGKTLEQRCKELETRLELRNNLLNDTSKQVIQWREVAKLVTLSLKFALMYLKKTPINAARGLLPLCEGDFKIMDESLSHFDALEKGKPVKEQE